MFDSIAHLSESKSPQRESRLQTRAYSGRTLARPAVWHSECLRFPHCGDLTKRFAARLTGREGENSMAAESKSGAKHAETSTGASQLGGGVPFWSPDKTDAHSRKMESSAHPPRGSSPIMPALLFLVLVTLLASSVEYPGWYSSAGNLPVAREVLAVIRSHGSPLPQDNVKVWTKQQFGFYYCQGDLLFGREPGKLVMQSEALLSGYRPVHQQYCTASEPKEESMRSAPPPKPMHAR